MGTTMSGRYMNTQGSGRTVSDFALVHSNEEEKMNFAEKYRELLKKRIETPDEILSFKDPCMKGAIALFAQNIPEAIEFLKNDCTEDEYSWISEIIEDIAAESESLELIRVYASLADKYPEETKRYNVKSFIDSAMAIAAPDEDKE